VPGGDAERSCPDAVRGSSDLEPQRAAFGGVPRRRGWATGHREVLRRGLRVPGRSHVRRLYPERGRDLPASACAGRRVRGARSGRSWGVLELRNASALRRGRLVLGDMQPAQFSRRRLRLQRDVPAGSVVLGGDLQCAGVGDVRSVCVGPRLRSGRVLQSRVQCLHASLVGRSGVHREHGPCRPRMSGPVRPDQRIARDVRVVVQLGLTRSSPGRAS
jgi:hypothetical protein